MIAQDDINLLERVLATKDDINSLEGSINSLEERLNRKFKNLEEKIDGVLEFAHIVEEERDKNEKRIKRLENKTGLAAV